MPKGKRKAVDSIPPIVAEALAEADIPLRQGERVFLTKDTVIKGMTIRAGTIGVIWGMADGRYKVNTKSRTFWTTDIRKE